MIGLGIVRNTKGEVLIDQRLEAGVLAGFWEFPGGKQEPGETIEQTIARELLEELAISVAVETHLISFEHSYGPKQLRFVVHLCRWLAGEPQPLESQQWRWVASDQLLKYNFPAANTRIIKAILELDAAGHGKAALPG